MLFEERTILVLKYQILLAVILLNVGCLSIKPVYYEHERNVAIKQVEKYHKLYNENKFGEIYEMFTIEQKQEKSEELVVSAIRQFYKKAGKVKNTKLIDSSVRNKLSHKIVNLSYQTEFENEKQIEKFVFFIQDEKVALGFYSQPKDASKD